MSSPFEEKVRQLSQAIEEGKRKINSTEQSFPTAIALGSLVPFSTMLLLFLIKPSFVKKYEGDKSVVSGYKFFFYTTLITSLLWCGMYILNRYNFFERLGEMTPA